jgi:predicted negative regulator of RcsB-dependent stress response
MAKSGALPPAIGEDKGESLMEWARHNSQKLALGGIVLVVVVAGGLLWRASAEKKEIRASQALAEVEGVVQAGNLALAQSDLRQFLQRYGGTTAAIHGRMLLAKVLFGEGKVEEGLTELSSVSDPGPFAVSFHSLRAAGLEQAGRPAEAAAAYEAAAEASAAPAAKAGLLADAARAHEAAGQIEEAKRIWSSMAQDDANPMSGEARVRLGELNATPIS